MSSLKSVAPLEPVKLSPPKWATLCLFLPVIIQFMGTLLVTACLNHASTADSISPSTEHINNLRCLEKGPQWMLTSCNTSRVFTTVFNLDTEITSPMPCASTFATVSILLLTVQDFCLFYQYFTFCYRIILILQHNFFYKTDHAFPAHG